MKTKNELLALLEIAIVLCSVFLVALPVTAIAAEQTTQEVSATASTITTASEDDFVLGVYGNANEDDTIDMRDLTYVKLIFFGKKPETELADAKYDGEINPLDFIQIKLIIVGKEKEMTIVDVFGEAVTVHKPVERVVFGFYDVGEMLRTINAKDKVVGVGGLSMKKMPTYFPELSKLPGPGDPWNPDYEGILALNADVYMPSPISKTPKGIETKKECEEKLPGVTIICLDIGYNYEVEDFVEIIRKLGYIFDRKDEAEEYINFYKGYMDMIIKRTEGLSADEKPRVYAEFPKKPYFCMCRFELCDMAGGINIGADLGSDYVDVDPEWVIEQNPDIIVKKVWLTSPCAYGTDDPSKLIAMREEILNRFELSHVTAIREKRVYAFDSYTLTIGPSYLLGIVYMGKWFHPDLFEDLDPKAIHQEYLTRFQHLDYDLNKHGVFVYPEEPV